VQHAYDTGAETYAELIPDTRREAPPDLAMADAFATAITERGLTGVAGFSEVSCLVRARAGSEKDAQAMLLARAAIIVP